MVELERRGQVEAGARSDDSFAVDMRLARAGVKSTPVPIGPPVPTAVMVTFS